MTIGSGAADQAERLRALNPQHSFIVQAPAGSGKTGLLIQRFLVLLARVESPEEIVAITFTRKAASEMRQRILQALTNARNDFSPQEEHARKTWELAQRVLAQDQAKSWQLLENPARLRIQTIDSLCAGLVSQMPILLSLVHCHRSLRMHPIFIRRRRDKRSKQWNRATHGRMPSSISD